MDIKCDVKGTLLRVLLLFSSTFAWNLCLALLVNYNSLMPFRLPPQANNMEKTLSTKDNEDRFLARMYFTKYSDLLTLLSVLLAEPITDSTVCMKNKQDSVEITQQSRWRRNHSTKRATLKKPLHSFAKNNYQCPL